MMNSENHRSSLTKRTKSDWLTTLLIVHLCKNNVKCQVRCANTLITSTNASSQLQDRIMPMIARLNPTNWVMGGKVFKRTYHSTSSILGWWPALLAPVSTAERQIARHSAPLAAGVAPPTPTDFSVSAIPIVTAKAKIRVTRASTAAKCGAWCPAITFKTWSYLSIFRLQLQTMTHQSAKRSRVSSARPPVSWT